MSRDIDFEICRDGVICLRTSQAVGTRIKSRFREECDLLHLKSDSFVTPYSAMFTVYVQKSRLPGIEQRSGLIAKLQRTWCFILCCYWAAVFELKVEGWLRQ